MIAEAIEARLEREIAWRQARNPDTFITSPNIGPQRMGFGLALNRHSTTVAREIESMQCVIVGVGSALRGGLLSHDWRYETALTSHFADAESSDTLTFDTSKDTQWLRTSLELSMAELAALFGVTRKAVYDWLDGAKTTKAAYIHAVRALIENHLPMESRPYLRQFWSYSPNGGESLIEIIKSGEPSRLPKEASAALADLKDPISSYTKQLAAKPHIDAIEHAHNADLYRSL
jgi:DNA-binding transcriptional regulator YiaG